MSLSFSNQIYTGFVPTQVATCALWMDGYDQNTFTFAGNVVSRWNDKSGSNYHGTSITGSPVYTASAINGRNAIAFNGSTAITGTSGSAMNTGTTLTCFAVGTMSNGIHPYGRLFSVVGAGPEDRNADSANLIGVAAGAQAVFTYRNFATLGQANVTYDVPFLACTRFDGVGNNTMFVNGTAGTTGSTSGNFGYTSYSVGQGSASYWTGFIGEVILYNGALSTQNRQTVEGYLAQKWGLTASLPAGHPGLTSNIFNISLYTPKAPIQALPYSATYSPLQVPGCALWLDAATSNSMTFASATNISSWLDKSGNGRHATQATASNQPHWYDNDVNGIFFDGALGQCLNLPSLTFTSLSIFMVAQATTYTYGAIFLSLSAANGIYLRSFTGALPGPTYTSYGIDFGGSNYRYAPSSAVIDTSRHLWSFTLPASGLGTFVWDGNVGNNAGGFTFANINTTFPAPSIGAYGQIPTNLPITAYIHEILMYSNDLTETNRQAIESYLAEKWKLTSNLPANHPNFTTPAGRPPLVTSLLGAPPQRILLGLQLRWNFPVTFTSTGADQTYTVPAGVTSIKVIMWGAGGGGGYVGTGAVFGGAGAYVEGVLTVTPGSSLTIVVGRGGLYADGSGGGQVNVYGGGGRPGYNSGGGGGRSAIISSGTELVTVGAGGGGSYWAPNAMGGAGDSVTGTGDNGGVLGEYGGLGGTQTAGGAHAINGGSDGSLRAGGNATAGFDGGGGGSGYYGGGAGGFYEIYSGGGGGSSYLGNLTSIVTLNSPNRRTAPNTSSSYYTGGAANGGSNGNAGSNGLVVILR